MTIYISVFNTNYLLIQHLLPYPATLHTLCNLLDQVLIISQELDTFYETFILTLTPTKLILLFKVPSKVQENL